MPVISITKSTYYIALLLVAFSAMDGFSEMGSESPSGDVTELSRLIQTMESENKRRDVALRNGKGVARIVVMAETNSDSESRVSEMAPNTQERRKCANTVDVCWCMRDDFICYDRTIARHLGDTNEPYKQCDPEGRLIVSTSPRVSIYYNPNERRAYINDPPLEVYNYTGLLYAFNIRRFYDIERGKSNAEILRSFDDKAIEVLYEDVDGAPCAHLKYRPEKTSFAKSGHRVYESDVFISLKQGYSIIRWNSRWLTMVNDQVAHEATEEYSAKYHRDSLSGGVWLISSMHRRDNCVQEQEMWVECSDQAVNIDVPENSFNYEGMGVPLGVPIFDKRRGNPAEVIAYVDGMYVGLDRIELGSGPAIR